MGRYDIALGRKPKPPKKLIIKSTPQKPNKFLTLGKANSGFPLFDLAANPVIPLQAVHERRFDLIERAQDLARREAATVNDWTQEFNATFPATQEFRNQTERENTLLPVLATVHNQIIQSIEIFLEYRPDRLYGENIDHLRQSMSIVQFRKDFLTYQIRLPRRMGNTTIAVELMRRHPDAIYIGVNSNFTREFRNQHPEIRDRVITATENQLMGRRTSVAIVDGASYFGARSYNSDIERVYERMNAEFYILLG